MTVGTDRRQWIAVFCGYTMQTTFVRIGLGPVAAAAVDQLKIFACGMPAFGRVQVRVAFHASHVGVDGRCVNFCAHEHRHFFASELASEFRVIVTLEAIGIVLCQCGGTREAEDRGHGCEPICSAIPLGASTHRYSFKLIPGFLRA